MVTTSSVLATSAVASPTSIGVFFDPEASDCDFVAEAFVPFNVYLSATLGTDAAGVGIMGADFRVDGLADIQWSVTPAPAAQFYLGNPVAGGTIIAFDTCVGGSGPQRCVPLFTVLCLPLGTVAPRTVAVEPRVGPCGPCWMGPWVTLCDPPIFSKILVQKGQALINNGSCTVSVRTETWTRIKSLYRANSALHAPVAAAGQR